MKIQRWLMAGIVAGITAFAVSSCAYDPYYSGSSYSSVGYGYGYGYGGSNFSTALFVSTGSPRWGYDPYAGAYYDYTLRRYYDPYLYGYYPVGYRPRYVHGAPHPHGWKHGRKSIAPPSRVRSHNLTNYQNRGERYRNLNQSWSRNVRVDAPGPNRNQHANRPNTGNNRNQQGAFGNANRPNNSRNANTPNRGNMNQRGQAPNAGRNFGNSNQRPNAAPAPNRNQNPRNLNQRQRNAPNVNPGNFINRPGSEAANRPQPAVRGNQGARVQAPRTSPQRAQQQAPRNQAPRMQAPTQPRRQIEAPRSGGGNMRGNIRSGGGRGPRGLGQG